MEPFFPLSGNVITRVDLLRFKVIRTKIMSPLSDLFLAYKSHCCCLFSKSKITL